MASKYIRRIVPIDGKQVQQDPEGTIPFKPPFGKPKPQQPAGNIHQRAWKKREQERLEQQKSKTIKKK